MTLGIRRNLAILKIQRDRLAFQIRKWLFGPENAIARLAHLDKISIIPVLQENGASIGQHCDIESPLLMHNCKDFANLEIGDRCHIGKDCFLDLKDHIILEDNVTISMRTTLVTHIDVGNSRLSAKYPTAQNRIRIGKDAYVGANSTILMGVELGHGCFVAAGSVVTKSFPANSFVAGVPAKPVRSPQACFDRN